MKTGKDPNIPVQNLEIATIIEVDGTHIIAELNPSIAELTRIYGGVVYPIGQFGSLVKIHYGTKVIYGYVGRLRMKSDYEKEMGLESNSNIDARIIEADLFGEGEWSYSTVNKQWKLSFERGISTFPLPLQKVYLTPRKELTSIFGQGFKTAIKIGEHSGSGGTPCYAELNELLGKHTAILGSTGSGKSATVAAIINTILDYGGTKSYPKWHPQIIILDPHNEYGDAFPTHQRLCTDEGTLKLPYWLLNLEETINLIIGKSEYSATSQVNIIKTALLLSRQDAAEVIGIKLDEITIDSPIPYSIDNFIQHVNNDTKKPTAESKQGSWNSVLNKLENLRKDARFNFLMDGWDGTSDPLPEVLHQFIGDCASIRIVDLSGVPNEIAGATSSAIARILFNFKLWQSQEEREENPLLLVCEEAHRYVPNKGEAQYIVAQEAIRRLAKEGRKYGIGLFLVSQRPSELESTVLSQCNSWIVLRMTNEVDRAYVKGILPDSLSGLTKMLSGLRRREAIFVGQATLLPSRILINDLNEMGKPIPRSHDINFDDGWQKVPISKEKLQQIGNRWRIQQRKS